MELEQIPPIPFEQLINQSLQQSSQALLNPLIETIKPLLGIISAIVGGLFGLYLIYIVMRLYYERKRTVLLRDIRFDLEYLNQHLNLPYSQEKISKKIIHLEDYNKLRKEKEHRNSEKKKK